MNVVRGQDATKKTRELRTDTEGRLVPGVERQAAIVLAASATLPASGAYEADPSAGTRLVEIPEGVDCATVFVSYTRGTTSGRAAHKLFLGDGTRVAQVRGPDPDPANAFDGVPGRASSSSSAVQYSIALELAGGATHLGIASAETGATGTPGTCAAWVTFS